MEASAQHEASGGAARLPFDQQLGGDLKTLTKKVKGPGVARTLRSALVRRPRA